jgi:hypothetical protein
MTPYVLVDIYRRWRVSCCLHFHTTQKMLQGHVGRFSVKRYGSRAPLLGCNEIWTCYFVFFSHILDYVANKQRKYGSHQQH